MANGMMAGLGGMATGAPPQRGAIDGDPLGTPPPSPTAMDMDPTASPVPGVRGLAGPAGPAAIPSSQLPPEILTGVVAAAQQITTMLDSFAQITPDKGAQLALLKDLLQQYLADLMGAGAGPIGPTASGPAFPGGGLDRGIAGAGAV